MAINKIVWLLAKIAEAEVDAETRKEKLQYSKQALKSDGVKQINKQINELASQQTLVGKQTSCTVDNRLKFEENSVLFPLKLSLLL